MLATTTYDAIRDRMVAKVEAITPASASAYRLRRAKQSTSIRSWTKTSAVFRGFEIEGGSRIEPPFKDPSAYLVTQRVDLTIAYPTAWGLYGLKDRDDAEAVIESDANQIRDALYSAGNYVAGQLAAIPLDREPPDKSDADIWFQVLSFDVTYYASQSLT
jgi:hypothetical protein